MILYLPVEEQLSSPGLGAYHSFGIRALQPVSEHWQEVAFLSDVSCDGAFVLRLAGACTQGQAALCHLRDIVLDALALPASGALG